MTAPYPVFDGHNDVLLRLYRKTGDVARQFVDGDGEGHLDLPRMREGRFGGGMFAIFVPSEFDLADMDELMQGEQYDVPLPPLIGAPAAQPVVLAMAAILFRIERASDGAFRVCRTARDIRQCIADGAVAAVFHIEGAEAVDADLEALEVLYQAGLRSLGPVWSRPTIFGHGVPFTYPSTPDTGDGLTDTGKALVKACNDLGIAIDLSHINEKGFWDVAKLSDAPLIATHSNVHAICPHARNLTDKQLGAIAETGGMVGLNYATCFLRPDGQRGTDVPFELMARHLDHLIERLGVDHVGLGSDFDGANIPDVIGDVTGLPALQDALRKHGYDEATLKKLCHENWIGVLERTWGE
ncbi:MAG: membrane dipeptidase [Brucellaceae bacterium]|nr:membrane dipeptidase [Brucellaceae bacterium]